MNLEDLQGFWSLICHVACEEWQIVFLSIWRSWHFQQRSPNSHSVSSDHFCRLKRSAVPVLLYVQRIWQICSYKWECGDVCRCILEVSLVRWAPCQCKRLAPREEKACKVFTFKKKTFYSYYKLCLASNSVLWLRGRVLRIGGIEIPEGIVRVMDKLFGLEELNPKEGVWHRGD